jgi:hypothetical protein
MKKRAQYARRWSAIAIAVTAGIFLVAKSGSANEPRPWLCRQIPVFSGPSAMSWRATQSGAGHWIMMFMHYDPAGGHDGFTVVGSREVNHGETEGMLDAGQYYAVALHRAGSHWICPANASEASTSADAIRNLCYGEDEGSCDLRLVVRAAGSPSGR